MEMPSPQEAETDLARREANKLAASRLRPIEFMEEIDREHKKREQRRKHFERWKWFDWTAAAIPTMIFIAGVAAFGTVIGGLLRADMDAARQPRTVIIQTQPATTPPQQ